MARQENRKPRVYHGVFASHPDNDTRLQRGRARRAGKVQNDEDRPANRDVYLAQHRRTCPRRQPRAGRRSRLALLPRRHGHHAGLPERLDRRQPADARSWRTPASKDAMMRGVGAGRRRRTWRRRSSSAGCCRAPATAAAEPLEVNGLDGYRAVVRSTDAAVGQQGPGRRWPSSTTTASPTSSRAAPARRRACRAFEPVFVSQRQDLPPPAGQRVHGRPSRTGSRSSRPVPAPRIEQLARTSPIKKYPAERAAAPERPLSGQGTRARPEAQDRGIVRVLNKLCCRANLTGQPRIAGARVVDMGFAR